jgi:hypothetical protein
LVNGDQITGEIIARSVRLRTIFGGVTVAMEHISEVRPSLPLARKGAGKLPGALGRGVVLYYSFDTNDPEKVVDLSGRGNTGAVVGPKWTDAGKVGGAYEFNGRNSEIRAASNPALAVQDALTLSAWVKRRAGGRYDGILQKGAFGASYGDYEFHLNHDGELVFTMNNNVREAVVKSSVRVDAEWHHVCATYDRTAGRMAVYVDGKPAGSHAYAARVRATGEPLRVGAYYGTDHHFNGRIDEVAVWNRALSSAEVAKLYARQKDLTR